eukprot:1801019-Pyramimonas_sp.AAC.1
MARSPSCSLALRSQASWAAWGVGPFSATWRQNQEAVRGPCRSSPPAGNVSSCRCTPSLNVTLRAPLESNCTGCTRRSS